MDRRDGGSWHLLRRRGDFAEGGLEGFLGLDRLFRILLLLLFEGSQELLLVFGSSLCLGAFEDGLSEGVRVGDVELDVEEPEHFPDVCDCLNDPL